MKNKRNVSFSLIIMLIVVINFTFHAQQKNGVSYLAETKNLSSSQGPNGIVRTIKQDRKGNIWITSWEGVFKYDGKSFTNVTRGISTARFFSVLEDRKGNFWFASIGSGVYYYDGKTSKNFTTKDGLASNTVTTIYEDKTGTIWFGTENGPSRYDGKSFRNLKMNEVSPVNANDSVYVGNTPVYAPTDSVYVGKDAVKATKDSVRVSFYQTPIPKNHWTHNDINAIIEDKAGKFWIATRGHAFTYDGKTITTIINKDGKPFTNVRSIIKDKNDNIWLGGADGLWRYDGNTYTNFTRNFVGYIYEDRKGNIWTSSDTKEVQSWSLTRYDAKSLSDKKPTITVIANKAMIFGILEDDKGNIWFGDLDGVNRYNGKTTTNFKSPAGQK